MSGAMRAVWIVLIGVSAVLAVVSAITQHPVMAVISFAVWLWFSVDLDYETRTKR